MSRPEIDCVVVGPLELADETYADARRRAADVSGAYESFKRQTLIHEGQRISYRTLLNRVVESATGRDPGLSLLELPSLATCHLTSYLQARGLRAEAVNFVNRERDRLLDLLASCPATVAVTTTLYQENDEPVARVVALVREHSPASTIVVGGPHVFNLCSQTDEPTQDWHFRRMGADLYVVEPQGRATLARVVRARREGTAVDAIPNLVRADAAGAFQRTPRVAEDPALEQGTIDWALFPPSLVSPMAQVETARSCPFHCAFCTYHPLAGPYRTMELAAVARELRQLHALGTRQLLFADPTLNTPVRRFKELCRLMARERFGFRWYSWIRCDLLDDEAIALMARSGCAAVAMGLEAVTPTVLRAMNKQTRRANARAYRETIRRLQDHGVAVYASLVVGFPGETADTIERTIEFLEEARPDFYRPVLWRYELISPIASRARELGIRGAAHRWRHATMSWREASAGVDRMLATVTGTTLVPIWSVWEIAYFGQRLGLGMDELRRLYRVLQGMMVQSLDETPRPFADELRALTALLAGTPTGAGGERRAPGAGG